MSLLIQYLVKLSISLAIVWLFYQFILRRLTFYNSNRLYLLAYTLLSFFIPFINISTILGNNSGTNNGLIQFIPSVHQYTIALEEASHCPVPIWSTSYDKWDWTAFALMIGAGILLLRFIVRYISFIRIRNRSKLISEDGIRIYQVNESIIPFSFGKSVFINSNLHTEDELREIVRHEFVHVKQNHTIDIIWAELLCIINWYNPFAWLLKRSIRQNLEFIADNKVVENGIDKKQYQYLLLKVIGNNQYSIASKFNFSSLKKRIAMMNKTKSAKRHLLKMLFLLPATAVLLLAFRNINSVKTENSSNAYTHSGIIVDASTLKPIHNVKILNRNYGTHVFSDFNGFFSFQANEKEHDLISLAFSKDGYRSMEVESISAKSNLPNFLRDIKIVGLNTNEHINNKGAFMSIIPVKPSGTETNDYDLAILALKKELNFKYHYPGIYDPAHSFDTIPDIKTPNSKGYYIDIKDNKGSCMVVVKDKNKKEVERLLLTEWNERSGYYENLYGEILSPTKVEVEKTIKAANPEIRTVTVKNNIATVTLKNGKQEVYTLSLSPEKKAFEERCGIKEEEIAVTEVRVTDALTTTEEVKVIEVAKPVLATTNNINSVQEVRIASNVKNTVNSTNSVESNIATIVEEPTVATERRILHLGGLTILDDGQYILLDGKEVLPASYGKLTGPYRIIFVDGKNAEKKYGSKGKNGAILLDTIR